MPKKSTKGKGDEMSVYVRDVAVPAIDFWNGLIEKFESEGYDEDGAKLQARYIIKFAYFLYAQGD